MIAPLTTAISTRDYEVGGIFNGLLTAPEDTEEDEEEPQGTFEVGYQIGCGIDMSTSNGVSLTGTVGLSPSIGVRRHRHGLASARRGSFRRSEQLGGGVTVGLKPGLINVVPVTKKEFKGAAVGDDQRFPRQDRRLRG